jgi:hypothetical protein
MTRLSKLAAALAAATAVAIVGSTTAAAASTRTTTTCTTRTAAVTGWSVYRVCLTATDSFDGARASGYVSGVSCSLYQPTAVGWRCASYTKGSYWNSAKAAWEDWLNFRLMYTNIAGWSTQSCVYLRIDTRVNGVASFQASTTDELKVGASC